MKNMNHVSLLVQKCADVPPALALLSPLSCCGAGFFFCDTLMLTDYWIKGPGSVRYCWACAECLVRFGDAGVNQPPPALSGWVHPTWRNSILWDFSPTRNADVSFKGWLSGTSNTLYFFYHCVSPLNEWCASLCGVTAPTAWYSLSPEPLVHPL